MMMRQRFLYSACSKYLYGVISSSCILCCVAFSIRSARPSRPAKSFFDHRHRQRRAISDVRWSTATSDDAGRGVATVLSPASWIIQWRGEGTEGYSETLRQLEFTSAFRAEMADYFLMVHDDINSASQSHNSLKEYLEDIQFTFQDALTYNGPIYYPPSPMDGGGESNKQIDANDDIEFEGEPIPISQVKTYESAMQYVAISLPTSPESISSSSITLPTAIDQTTQNGLFKSTIERCALIRTAFQIVAEGESFEELAMKALDNRSFEDMIEGGNNEDATWRIRLRRYKSNRHARYGKNVRSPLRDERNAILSMAELVKLFRGKVDLTSPQCSIYLLEGLAPNNMKVEPDRRCDLRNSNIVLTRVVAQGPKTSIYAPKTRICVTTTPLCPIASFTLCNIAQLQRHRTQAILDPFAGSCATFLAAAHISSECKSVGIELAHNGYVNRDDIIKDFVTRSLPPPSEIIHGDCLSPDVRHQSRLAIGGGAFDIIVTDPPYGIREAMSSEGDSRSVEGEINCSGSNSPLTKLFYAMGHDRSNGTPLLKPGGRLVAFVPVQKGESLDDCLPDLNARNEAGLQMEGEGKEQVLNDILSRWLVSFVCV